ncbi:MAG: 3-isopropylmalate dehydratase small subunit [bacterium]|nr:3-isopropylmalate dehydratase small subunit [Gammaproteobacteria bacterium]
MQKLETILSTAVPIMNANIDTDVITPMNRMTSRSEKPLSYFAFEPLRYLDGDADAGELNPDFPLNQDKYRGARIMICGENFGCGSSRESAPAVIAGLGFRCIIGSSFGDIFFNNCFQQGILPIQLNLETVNRLKSIAETGAELCVDLQKQEIVMPDDDIFQFHINALRRKSLLEGLDDIGITMQQDNLISDWQDKDRKLRPWIYFESAP